MGAIKDVVKPGIVLFLITAVMAAILAVSREGAKDLVAENERVAKEQAMAAVLPFEGEDVTFGEEAVGNNGTVYQVAFEGGQIAGAAVTAESGGYGGTVKVMVGVDSSGVVRGVRVISHSETPGLGASAAKPEFYSQFDGKRGAFDPAVKRDVSGDKEIKAITGATITSNAVITAVNSAYETALEAMGKGAGR